MAKWNFVDYMEIPYFGVLIAIGLTIVFLKNPLIWIIFVMQFYAYDRIINLNNEINS